MLNLNAALDTSDPAVLQALGDVQGNILKGHGRDHSAHLFIVFAPDAKPARAWLAKTGRERITSAAGQLAQTVAFRRNKGVGEAFACLALSARGYVALGVAESQRPADPFFVKGMKRHNQVELDPINDPPVSEWESGFQDEVHAMLLLADDDKERLNANVQQVLGELREIGAGVFVERGDKLLFDFPGRPGVEIEQFGYQDGISNPQMIVADLQKERAERGFDNWDPEAPAGLVLVQEKSAGTERYGSYFVFRKLEQNVKAFDDGIEELASVLDISPRDAGALAVGRHQDGTALFPAAPIVPGAGQNNFNFASDRPPEGDAAGVCPFHSHIRRTNPRGDIPHYVGAPIEFERSMRIARRGITYGARPDLETGGEAPSSGVGLLFMCHQAQLRQFSIQQNGSDHDQFPFAGAGFEGLNGQAALNTTIQPQLWPSRGGMRPHLLMRFVKMLGGEYFFTPSLPFLRELDSEPRQ
ncbi:hypothetical protein [Massilia sp. NR 4-1]|uniref:Dyp-type peroxidase n=1 Tax=Massilia sp. NR 4-1 TaxID=1678028 RepID=UPI00067B138C|nr:hypothetical protein [Massilia sp. NR 4-1]AKU20841.1 hypothetical protein ACZ75_04315 [Massilia sp. NR 4-1]